MTIELILGPMFSGKTTELMRRVKRHQAANRQCMLVKHSSDVRYSEDCISTHDQQQLAACACTTLANVVQETLGCDVIGIDEGQFFPDLLAFCEAMATMGKTVIVAALDGNFQRKPFGSVLELVPMSESVVKLNAVCMRCFADAAFTKRLGADTKTEIDIGGADKYAAVCRSCYFQSS